MNLLGGKWTTYRHMAEETVDKAINICGLNPSKPCNTKHLLLDGANEWSPTLFIRLIQDFGLDSNVSFVKIDQMRVDSNAWQYLESIVVLGKSSKRLYTSGIMCHPFVVNHSMKMNIEGYVRCSSHV